MTTTRTGAVSILQRRYIGRDAARLASLRRERINAEVAALIRGCRDRAGLRQGELAKIVGTTQSVISRLEDANYAGHSLMMLGRIAEALGLELRVSMADV